MDKILKVLLLGLDVIVFVLLVGQIYFVTDSLQILKSLGIYQILNPELFDMPLQTRLSITAQAIPVYLLYFTLRLTTTKAQLQIDELKKQRIQLSHEYAWNRFFSLVEKGQNIYQEIKEINSPKISSRRRFIDWIDMLNIFISKQDEENQEAMNKKLTTLLNDEQKKWIEANKKQRQSINIQK